MIYYEDKKRLDDLLNKNYITQSQYELIYNCLNIENTIDLKLVKGITKVDFVPYIIKYEGLNSYNNTELSLLSVLLSSEAELNKDNYYNKYFIVLWHPFYKKGKLQKLNTRTVNNLIKKGLIKPQSSSRKNIFNIHLK